MFIIIYWYSKKSLLIVAYVSLNKSNLINYLILSIKLFSTFYCKHMVIEILVYTPLYVCTFVEDNLLGM